MNRTLRHNLSASTVQLLINQLFGLLVFFVLSKQLSKAEFGEINWTLAVFLSAFSILSFGIDQVIVRKISETGQTGSLISVYLFHVLVSGGLFYASLILFKIAFPASFSTHLIFLFIGAGKLFLFISTPFKQAVAGKEKFNLLLYMSIPSNLVKGTVLTVLTFYGQISIRTTALIFITADLTELILSIVIFRFMVSIPMPLRFSQKDYTKLVRESLPQLGVNLFSSGIARFDWIFIGLFLSAEKLAEYSFAYKAFELCTLPMLVIAPLLVPLFSRLLAQGSGIHGNKDVLFLLKVEFLLASIATLITNLAWAPMIDKITMHRYGSVNSTTFFILSLSMPLLYLNNFLWSILFAEKKLNLIFRIFALTFVLTIAGDLVLIPLFKNEGAALAFLIAILVQTALYLQKTEIKNRIPWSRLQGHAAACFCSGWVAKNLFHSQWYALICGLTLYMGFLIFTREFHPHNRHRLKSVLNL